MKTTVPLTNYEQRGHLHHFDPNTCKYVITEGWFHLTQNGLTVARRKIRGRNTYLFLALGNVTDFVPAKEK